MLLNRSTSHVVRSDDDSAKQRMVSADPQESDAERRARLAVWQLQRLDEQANLVTDLAPASMQIAKRRQCWQLRWRFVAASSWVIVNSVDMLNCPWSPAQPNPDTITDPMTLEQEHPPSPAPASTQ